MAQGDACNRLQPDAHSSGDGAAGKIFWRAERNSSQAHCRLADATTIAWANAQSDGAKPGGRAASMAFHQSRWHSRQATRARQRIVGSDRNWPLHYRLCAVGTWGDDGICRCIVRRHAPGVRRSRQRNGCRTIADRARCCRGCRSYAPDQAVRQATRHGADGGCGDNRV